jgi:ferrous iron transport protein A
MTPPSLAATASPSALGSLDTLDALAPTAAMPFEDRHTTAMTLATAPLRVPYAVHRLVYPDGSAEWSQRLEELGFLPGERVMVLNRGWPGGDPIAVRVGHSSFALRSAEAACIELRPWQD